MRFMTVLRQSVALWVALLFVASGALVLWDIKDLRHAIALYLRGCALATALVALAEDGRIARQSRIAETRDPMRNGPEGGIVRRAIVRAFFGPWWGVMTLGMGLPLLAEVVMGNMAGGLDILCYYLAAAVVVFLLGLVDILRARRHPA